MSCVCVSTAELKQICGVNFTSQLVDGTRSVNLTWKVTLKSNYILRNVCVD